MINRLCIIGVGLIGGSLALALRRAGFVGRVTGTGRNADNLRKAVELSVIDVFELDPARAVEGADMVVLAVPLGAIGPVCSQIKNALAPGAVLTDVGSSKTSVVADVEAAFGELPACFVPGHPIAGTEHSGVEAAFAELFDQRLTIVTPSPRTDDAATARVTAMWEAAGAEVTQITIEHHDEVLAATSHLPHLLAFGLVDTLARMSDRDEIFRYAAGGFRDFTRIASSDPVMWRDVCLANRDAILKMIDRYRNDLDTMTQAIVENDGDALFDIFSRAKAARDRNV